MFDYFYPLVEGGDRFTMNQRIINEVGVVPTMTGDTYHDGQEMTQIRFAQELTPSQKTMLDALMADNPTFPPVSTGTRYIIEDIYEARASLITRIGITFNIYYMESVPGSGVIDRIVMQFPRTLTSQEKNRVRSVYSNMIVEG